MLLRLHCSGLRRGFRCWVSIGPSGLGEENWGPRITAVKNCSNAWGLRKLSFLRRAVVINALALSHIWYVASLLPMPNWVLGRNFDRQWGARGVVVSARDGHLVVHL